MRHIQSLSLMARNLTKAMLMSSNHPGIPPVAYQMFTLTSALISALPCESKVNYENLLGLEVSVWPCHETS